MSLTLIERLRTKPKHVRVQASFLAALSLTGMIALIWGATLPMRALQFTPEGEVAERVPGDSPLAAFFSDAKTGLAQVIGVTTVEVETAPADSATSASGAYQVGAPEDTEYPSAYERALNAGPTAAPVDRREVRVGTTTSPR